MGRIILKCIPLFLTLNLVYALPKAGQKTLYDEDEAKMLLNMAAASYGKQHIACVQRTYPRDQKRVILGVHREDCDWLSNTCVAFVVHSPVLKELIVVFRGTKTPKQLLIEGWKSLEPGIDFFDMGNVNQYFLNAHLKLWPGIEKMVSNEKYADHRIIFTGHSLGGALAALAAARTVLQGYRKSDQVKVVTFGQPRVGSLQFSRKFDEIVPNCFRIVFRRDLVPHLPTCKMIEPERPGEGTSKPCDADDIHAFYHHGVEIWYPDSMDNGSKFVECTGLPHHEDFNCSDQIKFFIDQSDSYLWDHRHYFGKMISGFGKTGCNEAMPEGEDGFFQKALNIDSRCECLNRIILLHDENDYRLLSSPDYPRFYCANLDCVWRIVAPTSKDRVYFFTDNLDLREDKDFLIFYDHELLVDTTDDNVTEAYRCTGDDACEFGSSSQYLTVRFTTAPGSSEKFGFQGSISSQDRLIGKVKSFAKHNWALLILIGIVLIGVIFSAICCVIQRATRKAEPIETREKLLQ